MTPLLLNNLKNRLQGSLPGLGAQKSLAPLSRAITKPDDLRPGEFKPSAVTILFYRNNNNELMFPLIQRLEYEGVHGGQIALPGGKQETQDPSLEQTALRECYEEIGVEGNIQMLGKLSPLFIPVSGYLVYPFVSYMESVEPVFKPQATEVQSVFSIKLNDLLDEKNLSKGSVNVRGTVIQTPYFLFGNKKVWGATAMILNEMKALFKSTF